jgi:hypothetical protein
MKIGNKFSFVFFLGLLLSLQFTLFMTEYDKKINSLICFDILNFCLGKSLSHNFYCVVFKRQLKKLERETEISGKGALV